ncbi:hypothetical protein C8035_v009875 [Colletotrichum spinosum]|uniref:SWIM-type domain-containing protein n=1 Tax=Colletotrichum spinosum TaxID=1347390 RepID=A0A4R8PS75_9PEZI|nr:hypothetical protein C8035_v009875 [Colletotrichum spinosum]
MPPTTRAQARRESLQTNPEDDSSSDPDSDLGNPATLDDPAGNPDPSIVVSPSKLSYRVDTLSDDARERLREAFGDPPELTLQFCVPQNNFYAFEMTELVHRHIRIGSPDSLYARPRCNCMTPQQQRNGPPCRHLIWLLDQLVKQTMYSPNPSGPLTMTPDGFPDEIGNPFSHISDFHLDVLAESLHCDVVQPPSEDHSSDSDTDSSDDEDEPETHPPNPHRIQEAREILSAVVSPSTSPLMPNPPEAFRPDLFPDPYTTRSKPKKPIKRRDLEATIFRMLVANDDFFHYFLSQMRPTDPVKDPFRKLSQRVDRVLRDLDAFAGGSVPFTTSSEGSRDVFWASRHISGVVTLIHASISRRDRPLEQWEGISAARALIHILSAVVERNRDFLPPNVAASSVPRADRNLYLRLVGDRDEKFVVEVLDALPPDAASPFLHRLEVVEDQLGVNGAPASYIGRFRALMAKLRRRSSVGSLAAATAGFKRQSQGSQERGSKRVR